MSVDRWDITEIQKRGRVVTKLKMLFTLLETDHFHGCLIVVG